MLCVVIYVDKSLFLPHSWARTNEVVNTVAHHIGGLVGAVEAEVLGHCLLLLGGLAHLLHGWMDRHTDTHTVTFTVQLIKQNLTDPHIQLQWLSLWHDMFLKKHALNVNNINSTWKEQCYIFYAYNVQFYETVYLLCGTFFVEMCRGVTV